MIIIDGVFFQLNNTGIARVWLSLLTRWAWTDFGKQIIVLDRGGTMPRIPSLLQVTIPRHNYSDLEGDRQLLQQVCDFFGARLFISTYYSSPVRTPSIFLCYDMIPEVLGGFDLSEPMWIEKHHAIERSSAVMAISQNSMNDLERLFSRVGALPRRVLPLGVDFKKQPEHYILEFRKKYGIDRPYFLTVGTRDGYKNAELTFKALGLINPQGAPFSVVCCGGAPHLEEYLRQYIPNLPTHMIRVDDQELQCAYSGAIALSYPSLYEGFGMPIIEAMACGCPVVTTNFGSIPEVAGDAALYVDPSNATSMANALVAVNNDFELRSHLIQRGMIQASFYTWDRSASTASDFISSLLFS